MMATRRSVRRRARATKAAAGGEVSDEPAPPAAATAWSEQIGAGEMLLKIHGAVEATSAQMKMLIMDRADAASDRRDMVEKLTTLDKRQARVESVIDRIEPVVWKHEADKQRRLGRLDFLKKGRTLWITAGGSGILATASHFLFGWPKIP